MSCDKILSQGIFILWQDLDTAEADAVMAKAFHNQINSSNLGHYALEPNFTISERDVRDEMLWVMHGFSAYGFLGVLD